MPSNVISSLSGILPGYLWPWVLGVMALCIVAGIAFAFKGKGGGKAPPSLATSTDSDETKSEKPSSKFFTQYYGAAFFFMIAVFAAVALLIIRPMIQDIISTDAQIASQEQVLNNTSLALNVHNKSVAAAQTISPDTLARVSLALPTDPGYPYILADLSAAAVRNGARLKPSVSARRPSVPHWPRPTQARARSCRWWSSSVCLRTVISTSRTFWPISNRACA